MYKVIRIHWSHDTEEIETELNLLAKDGWKIVCSYGYNNLNLILQKEKEK